MEIANVFEHVSKEKFRSAANKLLGECFLLKKHKDTASDYNYILNNKDAFIEYFEILGYEVIIDEQNGVIGLNNPAGTGRIHLKKIESVLLLIIRLLYIEKRKHSPSNLLAARLNFSFETCSNTFAISIILTSF